MFHFFFYIKKDEESSFKRLFEKIILSNMVYTKMILYFENKEYQDEFEETNPLYSIEKYRIIIFNELLICDEKYESLRIKDGYIFENICHTYGGLITFIYPHKLKEKSVDEIVSKMVESIQRALERQVYIYSSNKWIEEKEINTEVKEKIKKYDEKSVYDMSIMSIHYNAIWIKKMIFEIRYVNILESESDYEYFLSMLYYKYAKVYIQE